MSKFMLTAFAALAVTLATGATEAAFAGSDSYPEVTARPLMAFHTTERKGSGAYPVASGPGTATTESRVVTNDTGSDAMPLFNGQKAITDFGEPNRIVASTHPAG
jgi:hypothetical protein